MPMFRKKPVVIEAVQVTWENMESVAAWCGALPTNRTDSAIKIETLEGTMTACLGDWIIKGVKGEFYPCKPDIFEATYEEFK